MKLKIARTNTCKMFNKILRTRCSSVSGLHRNHFISDLSSSPKFTFKSSKLLRASRNFDSTVSRARQRISAISFSAKQMRKMFRRNSNG